MTENKSCFFIYQEAINKTTTHSVEGNERVTPPMDKEAVIQNVYNKLDKDACCKRPGELDVMLQYGIDNSSLFCGKGEINYPREEIIAAKDELKDIFTSSIMSIFPEDIGLDEMIFNKDFTLYYSNMAKDTYRGMEIARQCHACEQTGKPEIGGLIHITSAVMARYLNKTHKYSEKWNEDYLNSDVFSEVSNPRIVGIVDIIINAVEKNKDRYPILDKFFSSTLEFDEQKMTYYDFVKYLK